MSDDNEDKLSPSMHDAYMEVLRRVSGQPAPAADPEHGYPYAGETFAEKQKINNERFRAEKTARGVLHGAGELAGAVDNAITSNLLAPVSRGIHRAEASREADAQRRAYAADSGLQAEQWAASQANQPGANLGPAWNPIDAMEDARRTYEAVRMHVSAERLRSSYNSVLPDQGRGALAAVERARSAATAARAKQDAAALLDAAALHATMANPVAVPPHLAAHQAQQILQTAHQIQLHHALSAAEGALNQRSQPGVGMRTPEAMQSTEEAAPMTPGVDFGRADEGGQ